MIEIKYKVLPYEWQILRGVDHWFKYYPQLTSAIDSIKIYKPIFDSTYEMKGVTSFGKEIYFKFFDTKLNDFIPIESPWKVGLNDRNSIQISKLG